MRITEPTIVVPGVTAKPTSRGFVSVDIGPEVDPVALTPEILDGEQQRLGSTRNTDGSWRPSWKYRKEYLREFEAQQGQPVFEQQWLDTLAPGLREPAYRMDLAQGRDLAPMGDGRVAIYIQPTEPPAGPEIDAIMARTFAIGIDVSEGVAASNSVIEVFTADTYEQAAEFADANTTPSDLGRLAAAVGRYYNNALILCMRRIHGLTVLRTLIDDCGYPYLWHHRWSERMHERRAQALGWAADETGITAQGALLFGRWIDAVHHAEARLHSLACWQEHQQYIYQDGRIVHQQRAHLPKELQGKHSDRVVGCAGAYRAALDLPAYMALAPREVPVGSLAWRRQRAQETERRLRRKR